MNADGLISNKKYILLCPGIELNCLQGQYKRESFPEKHKSAFVYNLVVFSSTCILPGNNVAPLLKWSRPSLNIPF